jgi:tRNA-splicing ligase RtcB
MPSFETLETGRVSVKGWTRRVAIEEPARQQLRNLYNLSFALNHIAIMPDVHWGMGAIVGSVIATKADIVPATVSVDIGCGMAPVRLDRAEHLPDSLAQICVKG